MIFFRYTRFLENENSQLKRRIESLESRNQELVLALFQKGSRINPSPENPEKKHKITTHNNTASCSCGWSVIETDPGKLQQEISNHYRPGSTMSRKSWPRFRQLTEEQGENE